MSFGFTQYVDPGVYQQEVIVPSGINIPAQPFAVCLVGTGSRNKRVTNESVVRGIVKLESFTPAVSSPHAGVLANRALRRLDTTTVYRTLNGIRTEVLDQFVTFNPAYVLGTVTSTVDLTTATALDAFALEMDGIRSVTLALHPTLTYAAGQNVTFGAIVGNAVTITRPTSTFLSAGLRPGATITIALAEDAANNGDYTVTAVTSETVVSVTKNSGSPVPISASPDTAMTIAISGTGNVGREIHVISPFSGALGASATMTEIATAVNSALSSAVGTTLGFGSAYAAAATVSSSALRIDSQTVNGDGSGTAVSDVQVFAPVARNALTAIFGAPSLDNRSARSYVRVSDLIWNGAATWSADYVRLDNLEDPLVQTSNIQRIVSVGSSPGATDFAEFIDWSLDVALVNWAASTAALTTGISGSAGVAPDRTFDVSTNDQLLLEFDGLVNSIDSSVDVTVDLNGLVDPPIGYANPASAAAATASELVANINAVVSAALGPRYAAVASRVTVGTTYRVRLTSPSVGQFSSSVAVRAAPSASAHTTLFGGVVYPPALGTGKKPAAGTTYSVSYEFTRPTADYEIPFRHFSVEAAMAQVGAPSPLTAAYNPLAVGAQIAFENGAQFIYTVQVNDLAEGNPTRQQVQAALNGAGSVAGTTEVIVVGEPGTRLDVTTDEVAHLETQGGPIEKHYRRIFAGMASGTPIGDRTTVNSLVGRATRTLQVSPTSPGRGRMFMVTPPQQSGVTRNLVFEDGSSARVALDATYLAVAVGARRTSLSGPAETLTEKTITGFNTDDITAPWSPPERRTLAGQGCFVITYDAGRFLMKDALSTEQGGGGLIQFTIDSTSYQKDVIVTKVDQALDANIVGIVPFDLASFLLDIKLVIQGVVANEISKGTIGPYRDKGTGATRPIDLRVDIRVAQNVNVPTEFNFNYWFNLRYPALRLLGQYSVDNPFFALAA